MPNYLVTGASGQLGQCFQYLAKQFPKLRLYFVNANEVDITLTATLQSFYQVASFDGIINCAAYTQVDQAEKEPEMAYKINVEGLKNVIAFAEEKSVSLIHFSTDYVFSGDTDQPYNEADHKDPQGVYGQSKNEGEELLLKSLCEHVIIRTSWLFSPYGNNFVKTIARLAKERTQLKVVEDQWGRPTYGLDLAKAVLHLIDNNSIYNFPILHYANQGKCNWKQFAAAIIKEMGIQCSVQGVTSENYPTLAKRPKFSVLDTERIEQQLGIPIPTWQNSLKDCIQILNS